MDPVSAINTALTSLRTATDIARLLIGADVSLQTAELKLKLSDMMGALADAKSQIADVKDMVTKKDETIVRLQEALELKGTLIRKDSAYWLPDEQGNFTDGPFCMRCFDVDKITCRLVADTAGPQVKCPNCKTIFFSKPIYDYLRPDVIKAQRQIMQQMDQDINDVKRQLTDLF